MKWLEHIKLNKAAFYILSCTWGILYTASGALVALVLILTGHKPKRWGWAWYFELGSSDWGGLEWGPFFIKDREDSEHIKNHEFGHAIQNCILGPFMFVLVSLPSSVRYWTRRIRARRGHFPKSRYDAVWFEAQATRLGTQKIKEIRSSMFIRSTLCYIEKDGCYLMLYRNKKENDPCEGKWVGIGGKFEEGETAVSCLLREVWEETGLHLTNYQACGIVHFKSDELPDEDMYLFTATGFQGDLEADEAGNVIRSDEICNEGDLRWVPKEQVTSLNLWEGDRYFLEPLIAGRRDIDMLCRYEGDRIAEVRDLREKQ